MGTRVRHPLQDVFRVARAGGISTARWPLETRPCSSSRPQWRGKYVNGVGIICCNPAGRIIEFRVMLRPLQAVNIVQEQMKATLETLQP